MNPSIVLCVGLALAWVGERIVESPLGRGALSGLGLALVLLAVGLRATRRAGPQGSVHGLLLRLHLLALAALALYALQSDLFTRLVGASLESSWPKLAGVLGVLWPALLVCALLPTLLLELSFAAMARAPRLEEGRLREALYAGLGLAFTLLFAASVQYVVSERDAKLDLSYFRLARPGDATAKLVSSLDEPLEVVLFFPPASDVGELVEEYFHDLQAQSPKLQVRRVDHALEPKLARELNVSGNGTVVVKKGAHKELLTIGVELEKSRGQLRAMDGEVQKKVLQVGKARRTVYLTSGHGERTRDPLGNGDQRATVDILWRTLQEQNFEVRVLSAAEGLGQEVPRDAAAVFVIGPQRAFAGSEAEALVAFGKRGGRLFLALDPEPGLAFEELLAPLGLKLTPQRLAQERNTVNLHPPPSLGDRVNIGTRSFSSHPAATYLSRSNAPVLLVGAGGLDELPRHAPELVIDFAVRSFAEAWNDANENFQFDQGSETKKAWGLLAAVTRRAPGATAAQEGRTLVLSDSDAVADTVLPLLPGNQYLVLDGLKWLLGEEQLQGVTNTEVDLPLSRSRQQDSAWFYGTTFLAPLAVAGAGLLARRRPRKQRPDSKGGDVT
jgi:ABC-type uncharacterized transport system